MTKRSTPLKYLYTLTFCLLANVGLFDVAMTNSATATSYGQTAAGSLRPTGESPVENGVAKPRKAEGPIYARAPQRASTRAEGGSGARPRRPAKVRRADFTNAVPLPEIPPTKPVISGGASLEAKSDAATKTGAEAAAPDSFRYQAVHNFSTSEASSRSSVGNPSVGNMGNTIFYTGNWYAARSTNGGQSFTYVNPETTFASVNAGFCCNQVVNYAPQQDMMLWSLQYGYNADGNTIRIARAVGSANVAANSWTYYDFDATDFGFPARYELTSAHMTVGATYLYVTANVYDIPGFFAGAVIWRISLAELASGGFVNYSYYSQNRADSDIGDLRCTEGAGTTMYWAGHLDTSRVRIFRWDDGPGNISWDDVAVAPYTPLDFDGVATTPDETNWAARADGKIHGAWVAKGIIGLMWMAAQDGAFPYPYTVVARFSQSSRQRIDQTPVWSQSGAWLFPTASVNGAGDVAGLMTFAGGTTYPNTNIWVSDDVENGFAPLAMHGAALGSLTPSGTEFGDYQTVRPHKTFPNTWVAAAYFLLGHSGDAGVVPSYLWFGREREFTSSPAGAVNLTPFRPSDWSSRLVLSSTRGTHSESAITSTDTVYVDWAVINSGSTWTQTRFNTRLYLDGVEIASWSSQPPLTPNFYSYIEDHPLGSLSEGTHTLKIVTDVGNIVPESSESDNEFSKTITVSRGTVSRRPLIFVPGIAGSRLEHPSSPVTPLWPGIGVADFPLVGQLLALDSDGGGLQLNATDVIRTIPIPFKDDIDIYRGTIDRLTLNAADGGGYTEYIVSGRRGNPCADPPNQNANLYVFPYDWRRDNSEAATALNNFITCVLDDHPGEGGKVDLLTHSMGGLVAARYLSEHTLNHRVDRLVTIAAPWLGAPKAIDVLEAGGFMDAPWQKRLTREMLRGLSRNYRAVHQLLPTKTYFDLGGRPLIRNKLFGNDVVVDDYDEFVRVMDERFTGSRPGSNGKSFHDNPAQDDGSRLPIGIKYYHFYGVGKARDTLSAVKVPQTCISTGGPLGLSVTHCFTENVKATGDGTVPELSAKRSSALNPAGASVCKFQDTLNPEAVGHTNLAHHYSVLLSALRAFRSDSQLSCGDLFGTSLFAPSEQSLASEAAYYLTVIGARSVVVTDPAGASTDALSDPSDAGLANVKTFRTGVRAADLVIPTSQTYGVTLRADGPMFIQVTRETDVPGMAVRYQDLELPTGASARLRVTPQGIESLFYDANGDGTFETVVQPTVSLSGAAATDVSPPAVTFASSAQTGTLTVTISAADSGSGVKSIHYSVNGAQYKPYTGPLSVNPLAGAVVSAFAEDNAANRSEIFNLYPTVSGNVIDNERFFVQQHYLDFLSREADASGLNFWTGEITNCGVNAGCREVKRINVSGAFFLSIEFQETGYLVERMYKAAYGDATGITRATGSPVQIPVPVIKRSEFLADSMAIGNGVVVGRDGWQQALEENKTAFAMAFVQRTRFSNAYPQSLTASQFVDGLFAKTGVTPTAGERNAAISAFGAGGVAGRAAALRSVAQSATFDAAEKNRAFVLMQFFGYLQRDPDSGPDVDHTGYKFWLDKLNQFNGNFVQAEMVKAFLESFEYRRRFAS